MFQPPWGYIAAELNVPKISLSFSVWEVASAADDRQVLSALFSQHRVLDLRPRTEGSGTRV